MSPGDTSQKSPGIKPAQDSQFISRSVPENLERIDESSGQDTTIRRDYGTLSNVPASSSQKPRSSYRSDDGADGSSGMTPLSPQNTKPKKPAPMRRASTRKQLPHRGEQFSVDDDPSEVEEDRTPLTPSLQPFPTLTRQQSTVRRRNVAAQPQLPRVDSAEEEAEEMNQEGPVLDQSEENTADGEDAGLEESEEQDLSDAESFTLKDRQLAINQTHPFGIRIWKPALYKKNRSVEKGAEEDIHSSPSQIVSKWLWAFNCLWTVLFGWWLAAAATIGALACYLFAFDPSAAAYGRVFLGLSGYLFWPFGKFVKLEQDENYVEEDEGEGRSISEYERWQSGDLEYGRLMFGPTLTHSGSIVGRHRNSIDSANENDSLLARSGRTDRADTGVSTKTKRRLFGRGQWTLGRVIFFVFFYFNVAPLMLLVSMICWLMVFWIPMGRVTLILFYHLRKRPLSLTFHRDVSHARNSTKPSSIILCTYRAVGTKYWKYTVDGTNIFLINFLAIVVFVILDYFVLKEGLGLNIWLTSPALMFTLALISIIPLAYFIGQAVASISAQSSMGMGAAVNAFFSTIVEVYLYCIALNEGKAPLVEGSIIGSIFAGILLLPGLSMCSGAIKRKTQRFNVKSAGATSTMLLFAVIAAFGPTLFYKIYGSHELICKSCTTADEDNPRDCRHCYFRQVPAVSDDFFVQAVRPYCWFAAVLLFSSYIIGLLFTLRTHAAIIWSTDSDEKKPQQGQTADVSPMDTRQQSVVNSQTLQNASPNGSYVPRSAIRESQLYRRILGQSLRSAGLADVDGPDREASNAAKADGHLHAVDHPTKGDLPHVVPPKSSHGSETVRSPVLWPVVPGLSEEDNNNLVRQVAEMAATAATVAARDAVNHPRTASYQATHAYKGDKPDKTSRPSVTRRDTTMEESYVNPAAEQAVHASGEGGGHNAPNWSRTKSYVILLTATVAYAVVAEILVNTVDVVLNSIDIDEKFLGITLFALVPNTTEFLNAISFAMNGNIALSMEIGSAYALQVCLLQIPALVLFSAVSGRFYDPTDLIDHTFNLIFPQWDMVTIILCVFLLSYMYGEGKSNYFKGSILVMTYLVVIMGFYFSGFTTMSSMGGNLNDTLAIMPSMAWQQSGLRTVGTTPVVGGREL
ncbi:calcium/proton exchanger [Rhinocladiella mackenziei CBS 650.93]|uniref:Calcium/proton exchanger n=1 Tax=Rhinocladiella mackenziei CBS 650.93 TaxID=1442369 RepID=A0A0D2IHH4_9EURO|nr:calcium/proton exchanger [Rhinocladiella mackenziei CBS 650.93]KIX02756.1 calcium/proton exchanger [Rhinocladiella mackenziei CBS 650.93]